MQKKYPKGGIYAKKPDKKRTTLLKERVLLIPDDIDSAGINAGDIDRYYKHPYKLASQEEISKAIGAGEKGKAYIHYLWSDHVRMYQAFIIDTETGLVLNTFRPGQVNFKKENCIPAGVSYRSRINFKLKHLKRL